MNLRNFATSTLSAVMVLAQSAVAQTASGPVQIRAFYHNPIKPFADFFVADASGVIQPLKIVAEGMSTPQITSPVNGNIVLYTQQNVDPKKPAESLAASVALPADMKRVALIIFPAAAEGAKPPYRIVVMNDSPTAFKKGESRALNLTMADIAVEAGEHKLPVKTGEITILPAVTKKDEFNMAQTNFYYKEKETWVPFIERQLQYVDATRRIFLVYLTPGSTQPFVTTIVDNAPDRLPDPQP
jgi:hypothetical protein